MGGHFQEMLPTNIWKSRFAMFLYNCLWWCLVSCDFRMLDITWWPLTCFFFVDHANCKFVVTEYQQEAQPSWKTNRLPMTGIIKLPIWGGMQHYKFMLNLKGFRFNGVLFGLVHSLKLTWPIKMMVSNRNLLFQGAPIFRCQPLVSGLVI